MPRRSRAEAAETRERAVGAAARLFRGRGVEGAALKEVMQAIGMTHGGFYRHFDSKEALVAEAIDAAAEESGGALLRAAGAAVEAYLSPEHVAHPELGCPVAALAAEAARGAPATRAAMTRAIERTAALLSERGRADALFTLAALVGAVTMARASGDRELAAEILAAVRARLTRATSSPRGPASSAETATASGGSARRSRPGDRSRDARRPRSS